MIVIPGAERGTHVRVTVEQEGMFAHDAVDRLVELLRATDGIGDAAGRVFAIGRLTNGFCLDVILETDRSSDGDAVHLALDAHHQAWDSAGLPWAMQFIGAMTSSRRRLDELAGRESTAARRRAA